MVVSVSLGKREPTEPPLKRRLLREQIREKLIEQIVQGRLQPGARIVETRIAREFGVSQAPVREAFRDLELLGFVVSSAFRGVEVRRISIEELAEICPIRAAIEGLAARAAATRLDQRRLMELEGLLRKIVEAASHGDEKGQVAADIAFHRYIVEASGSRLLNQFWQAMQLPLTIPRFYAVARTHRSCRETAEQHWAVLNALRAHDPAAAEAVMRAHLDKLVGWMDAAAAQVEPVDAAAVKS